mgnify:CR=1 FL=1
MSSVLLELAALCIYGPALVLVHEGGHAAFARLGGYRVTSFGIGLGRPLWSGYVRDGVVVHVDRWLLAGGACTAIPLGPPGPRRAWFHGGGLLVQLALAVVLLALPSSWIVERIASFNVLVAATNAVPWRTRAQASDGWHLLDALAGGRRMGHPLGQRAHLRRMLAREVAVSSPVGSAYCDVVLAWSDVQLGLLDSANERLVDAAPQATREPWIDALHHLVRTEWHRARGEVDEALSAVRLGQGLEGLDGHARALLDHAEARTLVDAGRPDQARATLARVVGYAGLLGNQAAVTLLLAELAADTIDRANLEHATWRVERRIVDGFLDPIDTLVALHRAAAALDDVGRVRAAQGARASALTLRDRTVARAGVRETAWADAQVRRQTGDSLPPDADEAILGAPSWW